MEQEAANALGEIIMAFVLLIIVSGLVPATDNAMARKRRREEDLRRKYPDPFMRERMRGPY